MKQKIWDEKLILPDFPRTKHLPIESNATSDDRIASMDELKWLLTQDVHITEKIDGANSGISLLNNEPLIRNRTKILNKNYQANGKAKVQFSAIWTWFYNNKHKLENLADLLGYMPSVYGEWLYAKHTIFYDQIPDWFVAYDIYNPNTQSFLCPHKAEELLKEAGFDYVPFICSMPGGLYDVDDILVCRKGISRFSTTENIEGIYLKVGDGENCIARYKMVAPGFKSDDNWSKTELIKNIKVKK